MKKLIFTLTVCLAVCAVTQAQSKNDLKGPKAKNYKVWQDDSPSIVVYTDANKEVVKGPEAKNKKVWETSTTNKDKVVIKRDTQRTSLKGPAAKNYKPWQ
ncbi:hypothetical protein N7E81_09710 [Reichenbachiella carrageenanivorans]|uniref:Uncharacterized protein n=1 Tax=Reichenbachiella carrageenanivorans TaxID=2979869 RepID=A0ABY6CWC8_9BACT|nr:hypothetical protein [Reichenbachiella carrageenanivorans]UXX77644.1 hypothetical protein N7E81_09710 [Reichenbachiella carrageenanivorans]